jgi:hypothetical protein
MQSSPEQLEKEAVEAEKRGLVRVPPDKCGLYSNTFVYMPAEDKFRVWRGSICSKAGRISYPVYVRKEHFPHLRAYESGPAALMHQIELKLGDTKDNVVL